MQVGAERCTGDRARITPAWFWLCTFEVFYYTGIRLNALLCIRKRDIDWDNQLILIRGETEKTHKEFVVPITEGLVLTYRGSCRRPIEPDSPMTTSCSTSTGSHRTTRAR